MSLNQPPPTASAEELQEEIEFTQLLLATLDTVSDTYWPDKLEREQHIANLQSRLDAIRGSMPGPSYMSAQLSTSRKRPRAFEDALAAEYLNKSSRTTPSPAVTPDTSSSTDSFPELFETWPAQPQAGGVRQAHSSLHSALGASAGQATHQQLPRIPGMSRPSPHRLPSMQRSPFPRPLSSQPIKSEFSRGTPLRTPTQPPRGYSQNQPPRFAQPSASNDGVEIIDLCGSDSDSDVQEMLPLRNSNYNQGYGSSSAFMPRSMQQPNRFSVHRQPNPARTPAGQSIYNTLRGTMNDPLPVDDFDGMLDTIHSPLTFGEIQRGSSFMRDPLQSSSQHQNLLGYHAAAYGLGSMPGAWPTFTDPIHMLQREREWHDRYDGYGVQQGARSAEDTLKMLGNIGFDEEIPPEQRLTTPPAMAVQLMEHQKLGVSWMKKMEEGSNKGSILADEMGLGKTVQALSLIVSRPSEDPMRKTTLVVAPVALMRQWEREIKTKVKNSHALSVITYHGSKRKPFKELRQYDVVLTSFGTLTSEFGGKERIREFEARTVTDPEGAPARPKNEEYTLFGKDALWYRVILDEAHTIRNKETKASRACCELKTIYRLCMTGTPMMNRTDELYGLVRFLRIKPYCEWNEFRQDIKTSMEKGTPDIRQDGLRKLQALLKAILLRRTQESKIDGRVIFQLPPKTIIRDNVVFGEEQQEFYNALETKTQLKFNKYLKQGTVGKQYSQILVLLLRLRQACCHPHLLKDFAEPATDLPEEQMLDFARQLSDEVVARIKAEDGAFSCPICLDGVENPAIFLPCGHNACSECFARITSEPPRSDEGYKCPNCRGKLNPQEITDYNSFKKVHMSDTTLINGLGKLVDDETTSSSDDESQSEDEDEDDDLDGFIARDEEVEGSASGFASEHPKKSKKARGKEKKRDGAPKQKQTLAQLRRDAQKNILAKRRYFKRLCKDWITSAKVDKTMVLLRDIKEADPTEKTLVFSQFTSFLDILEVPMNREGFDYTRLDGTMSPDLRNDAVNQFIDSPTHNVMLISLKAGNAGLNLNAASQVIILDPFWNPYIEYQAIGRAHRLGQTRAVTVHRILVPKTVEDRIMDLQSRKEEMITKALDEDAGKNISRLGVKDLAYLFVSCSP
ncbi:SNF2 family N-terminal domain-containing protein [Macrophomina phaseolina]|uniref:SNF2 family N-terminal domain-containing protein n=1 Tax=Macrophomina phaseolina TaxID=35725 RepID=A0ABQ8GW45_9PEZI|nr:SNF2 family N-terminal domain-containing protein [Macrophomina phaseolina]